MNRTAYRATWIVLVLLLVASTASAGGPEPKIKIAADGAPNIYGSPGWNNWVYNAVYDISTDGPASFEDHPVVGPGYFVVSEFPSWLGQADPGTAFGPAYANELGTRLHWVTRVTAPKGQTINIAAGLEFWIEPNAMTPDFIVTRVVTSYSGLIIGVDYGPDGVKGGGDDVWLTSGTGDVEEIVMVRPGFAYWDPDTSAGQANLDGVYAYVEDFGMLHFRACASFAGGKVTCAPLLLNTQAKGRGVTGIAPSPVTE